MIRLMLLLLLLISTATATAARMYQWQDPNSKSIQFSGVPPAWYRGPDGGPRVRVYEGGKLIDDTYVLLSAENDRDMRDMAFRALQEEQQLEAIKRLERAARREESRRQQAQRDALKSQAKAEQPNTTAAPPDVLPESLDPEMVDRLKAIIAEYDRADTAGGSRAPSGLVPEASSTTTTTPAY
jgi:hypothetical protein